MARAQWIGLHSNDKNKPGSYARAIDRMIKAGGNYDEVLEDIGKTAVTRTTAKLTENRVRPKTSNKTLLRRRTRSRKPSTSGITLVDTAQGMKQVSYSSDRTSVSVGVPDGYMAYHQQGRVPNSKRRRFLVLPTKNYTLRLINFHWKKALRS